MPGYIEDALTRFKHARSRTPQDQTHPHIPPKIRCNATILQTTIRIPPPWQVGKEIHRRGVRYTPLLRASRRLHDACRPRINRDATRNPNSKHHAQDQASARLRRNPYRLRSNLLFQQHGTGSPQRRLIPIEDQVMKPHRRSFLHGQQHRCLRE